MVEEQASWTLTEVAVRSGTERQAPLMLGLIPDGLVPHDHQTGPRKNLRVEVQTEGVVTRWVGLLRSLSRTLLPPRGYASIPSPGEKAAWR